MQECDARGAEKQTFVEERTESLQAHLAEFVYIFILSVVQGFLTDLVLTESALRLQAQGAASR